MTYPLRLGLWCLGVVVACILYWACVYWRFGISEDSAHFGDMFGALNTLFTGLAFAGVVATLWLQSQQVHETKKDAQEERRFRLQLDLFDKRFQIYETT